MVRLLSFDLDSLRFDESEEQTPLQKATIEELARQRGINLPCEYIQFLCLQNGGTFKRSFFPMAGQWFWINRLYYLNQEGFLGNEQSDVFSIAYYNAILQPYIPDRYTIIGSVVRDDLLLICNTTGQIGVVIWDDVSELDDRPSNDVVVNLAESFLEFLKILEDYDEYRMQIY